MIDLILVLMVFFMTTVALKQVENELGITLPGQAAMAKTQAASVDLRIGIDPDGSISLNDAPIGAPNDKGLEQLRARLKEQVDLFGDKIPVTIIPQPDVPHHRIVDVLNACSAVQIKNISFGGT
ncbi:MAG: biopolymer transporter ExbD [Verrucomicrobiae bacterium]|nr:biopolymer transporter ExbD [Verrucomicrobiae bacterium]